MVLIHILGMLQSPPTGVAYIIYNICYTEEIRKYVKYNGELDQFEIPISVLRDNKKYFTSICYGNVLDCLSDISSTNNIIEGTQIRYYIDLNNNFCFSI